MVWCQVVQLQEFAKMVTLECMNSGHVVGSSPPAKLVSQGRFERRAASDGGHWCSVVTLQEWRLELLWEAFVLGPREWWDNKPGYTSHGLPDVIHNTPTRALWLKNCYQPSWVDTKLALWTSATRKPLGCAISGSDDGSCNQRTKNLVRNLIKCVDDGDLTKATEAVELVVKQGCSVGKALFYRLVKMCIAQKNLKLGRRIHDLTMKDGCEFDTFWANHIIRLYASFGRLDEASGVFAKVSSPDTFMWFSLISAHVDHGQTALSVSLYRQMRKSSVQPNSYVFVAALKACAALKDSVAGKEIHDDIGRNFSASNDIYVRNALIDMYSKCGSLVLARQVFDASPARDVVTWNTMLGGYAQRGLGHEAVALYAIMQQNIEIVPNQVTFICLLQACASVNALNQGKELHAQIKKRGLEFDVMVGSALVDMYGKCGSLLDAEKVFENLPSKNVVTWTAMIAGYAQHKLARKALALYANMQCEGISPADHTFVSLLKACASLGDLVEGRKLHECIQDRGLVANMFVANGLVDMYAKCGSLNDAQIVFDRLPTKDVVTWNVMLTGYVQQGLNPEALALYANMQEENTAPDSVTFVCLLQACASTGALHMGKLLHAQIQKKGLEADVIVGNCLVNMYAKCGSLEDARGLFDTLTTKDVVTWNALLNGYAEHSNDGMATHCFEMMCQEGVSPDDTTFISLLVACSHSGLVNEGQRYFNLMTDHGLVPKVNHYNCMVDLLGRSGRLHEAEDLLRTMPYENDFVGWTSLLTACKSHGDVVRGERCFDRLTAMQPKNGAPYVLLGHIYANAGRWTDVDRLETSRKLAGAGKKPAKACIELRNKVHEFSVGEVRSDVSLKVRIVSSRLKEGGHVPQTQLVRKTMSLQAKEDALCGHAEKLALAYGLLNTPDGATLLVTKNLRMCNDCHSGTKIMSSLENREIIVRDAHRVHRFLDGSCSCGDRH